jgi:hypothetical protein
MVRECGALLAAPAPVRIEGSHEQKNVGSDIDLLGSPYGSRHISDQPELIRDCSALPVGSWAKLWFGSATWNFSTASRIRGLNSQRVFERATIGVCGHSFFWRCL